MKRRYELTAKRVKFIKDASKPTPAMYLPGGSPMFGTPQLNANRAWAQLGRDMGFDPMTVSPPSFGEPETVFYAEPVADPVAPVVKAVKRGSNP